MEFQRVVRKRRMVRNFDSRPVPPEVVQRLLDNARRAPSAGFSQGWAFLVLQGPTEIARFWSAVATPNASGARQRWPGVMQAPLIIVPFSHKQAYLDRYAEADKGWLDKAETRWPTPFWDIDTAFAAMSILLTAVDAELGALYFGITEIPRFRAEFGVPDAYHPIGAIALGYPLPDEPSPSLKRGWRPAEEVIHWGAWGADRPADPSAST